MQRKYSLNSTFESSIEAALKKFNLSLQSPKDLAKNVLQLSNFFIEQPLGQTPWHESWAQIAYLCYYLPLNMSRVTAVVDEGVRTQFFDGLENVYDFGAGLATASLSLSQQRDFKFTLIERSTEPQNLVQSFFPQFKPEGWQRTLNKSQIGNPKKSLALFSYSLTELTELPEWATQCEGIMILEPSTQQDGRKLLNLRAKLIDLGYSIWAPCTHQLSCPLLNQSKTDWCHDRIFFEAPEWFQKMEEHLPMKNRTLTMSYLLARKSKPPALDSTIARVIGDTLKEKGKDRQMICRGVDREFLAWMHKNKIQQDIPRGALISIPVSYSKISNEIRVMGPIELSKFS